MKNQNTLLVTDSFLKLQKINEEEYFIPQIEALNGMKQHHFTVLWSANGTRQQESSRILEMLERMDTPVTLVGHGKGGVDALDCLLENPTARSKVSKLILLQAPVWGTPIADFLTGHPLVGCVVKVYCYANGISMHSLEELSEMNRQVYMILNKEKLQTLMNEVSVVSVGTSFDLPLSGKGLRDRLLNQVHRLISKHAGLNDGMIPLFSTRVSGEAHIQLEGISHTSLVTPAFAVANEVQSLMKKLLSDVKPDFSSSGLSGYRPQSLSVQSEERSGSEPHHSFQLEIS